MTLVDPIYNLHLTTATPPSYRRSVALMNG